MDWLKKTFKPLYAVDKFTSPSFIVKIDLKHFFYGLCALFVVALISSFLAHNDIGWPAEPMDLEMQDGVFLDAMNWHKKKWMLELLLLIVGSAYSSIKDNYVMSRISNGDFKKNIFKLINNAKEFNKEKNTSSNIEITNYLKFINLKAKSLEFEPDIAAIDMLQETNGLISITNANPIEWLDSTYNFYLVNNLLSSFTNNINKHSNSTVQYVNNDSAEFTNGFLQEKTNELEKIKSLGKPLELSSFFKSNPNTFRFYFLTKDEFNKNKYMIELLIAYHNLFGTYIYFINQESINLFVQQKENSKLNSILNHHKYDYDENQSKIDLAFGFDDDDIHIILRKNGVLTKEDLEKSDANCLLEYLQELISEILGSKDNSEKMLYYTTHPEGVKVNSRYCYAQIKPAQNE